VVHGLALNITVQSYDQSLDFGLMADAAAMPEVHELAAAIGAALDEVRGLPVGDDPSAAPSAAVPPAPKKIRAKKPPAQ